MTAPIPQFDLGQAPPGRFTMPSIVGSAIDAPRSLSGISSAIDLSGGGLVTVKYANIQLGNSDQAALRYWSNLAGMLNGGVRSILVPLLVDRINPDGFTAVLKADAAQNAATVEITAAEFVTDNVLAGGEWFEIAHASVLSRAYTITDVLSAAQNSDGTFDYQINIRPPLRAAVAATTALSFYRPRCLMRLLPGTTITADVEKFWWATPDVTFIESAGGL